MTATNATAANGGTSPPVGSASGSAGGDAPTVSAIARALLLPAANETTPPPSPPAVPSSALQAANEPTLPPNPPAVPSSMIPAAEQVAARGPRAARHPRHVTLKVQVEAAPRADHVRLVPIFWKHVGDLVAEALLDDVGEPGGATDSPDHEILAS